MSLYNVLLCYLNLIVKIRFSILKILKTLGVPDSRVAAEVVGLKWATRAPHGNHRQQTPAAHAHLHRARDAERQRHTAQRQTLAREEANTVRNYE